MTAQSTNIAAKYERPIRVLLVEDDPTHQDRLRRTIEEAESAKFEVDHASDVEQALAKLRDGVYDVMLLDLTLSEGDGLGTLERAKVAAASVPIIALASDDDSAQAIGAVRMGAQDCLDKGVEPRQLIRILRHAVERHQLLDELHVARQREHFVATHDSLTGLPNRFALEDHLKRALAYAERYDKQVAVMFLDLDRFKNINDTMGHHVGDRLLQLAAERMRGLVRKSDMLARLGGDEFILLLQGIDHDYAPAKVAENILSRMLAPYELLDQNYRVTGSIGIAVSPRDGASAAELIRNADTAMYQAKAQGGDCYQLYDQSMNDTVLRRVTLENKLREAFEKRELKVFYQPKVCFRTGAILGSEALLRWTDSELGVISPVEFIPLAEETNLIREIGDWTLQTACAQTKAWQQAGFPKLSVAVNLSACQIAPDVLRQTIVSTLWESGLAPAKLELELTESVLMRNDVAALDVLKKIKKIGVGLALDDFGTGFSSLSYLKAVPIDTLKIDQSFVRDYGIDSDDEAIISAVLSISEKMDFRVVAEGVETEKQHRLLAEAGCHEFQGFLYSPAVSGEDFLELLKRGTIA
jgi:diguanylate cyclase (GGDEF)-like protein